MKKREQEQEQESKRARLSFIIIIKSKDSTLLSHPNAPSQPKPATTMSAALMRSGSAAAGPSSGRAPMIATGAHRVRTATSPLLMPRHSSSTLSTTARPRGVVSCRGLFGLGLPELAVIAGVTALIFGPSKLPELGKGLGKTVKSFQTAAKEFETELKAAASEDDGEKKPEEKKEASKQ